MAKQYERYTMGNDLMRSIKDMNEKILNDETLQLAQDIEKEYYPDTDNERQRRLCFAINEMYKLIELGGEVHPSLILKEAKGEVIDYKQLINLNGTMGMLPINNEKNDSKTE